MIERAIQRYMSENVIGQPKVIVMDSTLYFEFKKEVLGSYEMCFETEVENYNGLEVFHNNKGWDYVNVY